MMCLNTFAYACMVQHILLQIFVVRIFGVNKLLLFNSLLER